MPLPKRLLPGCLAPSRQTQGENALIRDQEILDADFQDRLLKCTSTLTQTQIHLRSSVQAEIRTRESSLLKKRESNLEVQNKLSVAIKKLEYEKAKKEKEEAGLQNICSGSKKQKAKLDKSRAELDRLERNVEQIQRQDQELMDEIKRKFHVQCSHVLKGDILELELRITNIHPLYLTDEYEMDLTGNINEHPLKYTNASVTPTIRNFETILNEFIESQDLRRFYESVISAWKSDSRAPLTPRLGRAKK